MRPFAIQSVGLRPDLPIATLDDLRDGGVAQLVEVISQLRASGRLRDQHSAGHERGTAR